MAYPRLAMLGEPDLANEVIANAANPRVRNLAAYASLSFAGGSSSSTLRLERRLRRARGPALASTLATLEYVWSRPDGVIPTPFYAIRGGRYEGRAVCGARPSTIGARADIALR